MMRQSRMFQSTRPVKDATACTVKIDAAAQFQSTRPVKDATRMRWESLLRLSVSIHASREGRDRLLRGRTGTHYGFNPRVP